MAAWFIAGCSSGLGRSLVTAMLGAAHDAVVTARDADKVREFEQAFPHRRDDQGIR